MNSFLDTLGSLFQKNIAQPVGSVLAPAGQAAGSFLDHIGQGLASRLTTPLPPQTNAGLFQQPKPIDLPGLASNLSPYNFNTPVIGGVRRYFENSIQPAIATIPSGITPAQRQNPVLRYFDEQTRYLHTPQGQQGAVMGVVNPSVGKVDLGGIARTFAPKLRPEDVNLIGQVAQLVETKGPKVNLGEMGADFQRMGEHVFGPEAATWSTQKLKSAFDLVLQKIGQQPNRAGLGLGIQTIEHDAPVQAPKTAGFSQFWDRARNVIAKQGPAGQQLSGLLQQARSTAETTAGQWVSQLKTVGSLSKQEFNNFVDVAEGAAQPLNQKVAQAAAEWGNVREQVYGLAQQAGLDIGKLENYFPHVYDQSLFEGDNYKKAIEQLVESGQAKDPIEAATILRHAQDVIRNRRQGNLELERLVNLPGYEKSKDALFGYLESAANRIAQVTHFGKDDTTALGLINNIAQEGGDAGAARNLFDISVGAKKYGDLQQQVSRALRGYNSVTKLGLGAITNAGQTLNTATVTGARRTVSTAMQVLLGPKTSQESRDFALKAGVTLDGVIQDLKEGSGFAGKVLGKIGAPGFNTVEKFNRTLAAWAGKNYAQDLAQQAAAGSQDATRALQTMGLDTNAILQRGGVLSEAEQVQAARNIVERTQFKVDPQDLPGWASSPWGKVLTQFKGFAYNQSAFIGREIIQPALKGNVKPLVRFIALGLPVGAAATESKNLLRNRPSEENPTKRVEQYYQQAGGLGLAGDVITGLFPQNGKYLPQDRAVTLALGTIGGPTLGTAADAYGSLSQAVQGKPTSLERFGLRQVPLAGSTLSNTILPYKPGGRSGSAGTGSASAATTTRTRKTGDVQGALALLQDPTLKAGVAKSLGSKSAGQSAKQQKALVTVVRKYLGKSPKARLPRLPKPGKPVQLKSSSNVRSIRNPVKPVRRRVKLTR